MLLESIKRIKSNKAPSRHDLCTFDDNEQDGAIGFFSISISKLV